MNFFQFNRIKEELGFFVSNSIQCQYSGTKDWKEFQINPSRFIQAEVLEAMLARHQSGQREIGLNRRYDPAVPWKDLNVPGQSVLAIDIDGRNNTDLNLAVKSVVEVFEQVKFIEYSALGEGYHLYLQIDRPVVDDEIRSTVGYFKQLGVTIEIKLSSQKLRFPMGARYSTFGIYDPTSAHSVLALTVADLFDFWEKKEFVIPFPFDLQWHRFEEEAKVSKFSKSNGKNTKNKIVTDLLSNQDLDYGVGTRHLKLMRIVGYCSKYSLGYENFVRILDHHNKGSTTKTDTRKVWDWARATWGYEEENASNYSKTEFGKANEQKLAEIVRYAGTITLTDPEKEQIRDRIAGTLEAFIVDKISGGKPLNNPQMMTSRFEDHILKLCSFIKQYQSAKAYEWENYTDDEKIQPPITLLDMLRGVPISHRFLQWLKPKLHCSYLTTLLPYLVEQEVVRVLPLSDRHASQATYAPGRCNYYELNLQ